MKYDVISFAREELTKYLSEIHVEADIKLCLFDELGLKNEKVLNSTYDDAISISVKDRCGYIAGSNERSVLIGVYRLLDEWGIKWIRPGKYGTYIPKTPTVKDLNIEEAADKRHRTMCIEGAISIENALDMIDWLPKVGFNGYYIQFNDAYIFFDRWYSHRNNPCRGPEPFTKEKSMEYVDRMIQEIKRRGLILQRMGHGWTCDPFGVIHSGWDAEDPSSFPKEFVDICALVNGERKVWKNIPLATQLCYSNPFVQNTIVDAVIDYVHANPETDIIYFWLGDYYNNYCECPECIKYTPSDYYLEMVNKITDRLTKEGLKNKIVFSLRSQTPIKERIIHTDNTMMMMAPISRTFGKAFPGEFKIKTIPEFKLNTYNMPRNVDENLSYLYAWEQLYKGDIVDFDYHLMWDHILDAGGECIAKVLYDDARNFDALGMNGFISCQLQRNSFPTSVAMTVMAKTLWNNNSDFDKIRRDLYAASFGEESADYLCKYFSTLSKGFDIGAIRSQVEVDREEFKQNMRNAVKAMDDIEEVIAAHINDENPCHRESWRVLDIHRKIYGTLGRGIIIRLEGDIEGGNKLRDESVRIAWENEEKVQPYLDCMFYDQMTHERINLERAIEFFDF